MQKTRVLADIISHSRKIVVLTGAGISTESNIPDFRHSFQSMIKDEPEYMTKMTAQFRDYHPKQFWEFFRDLLAKFVRLQSESTKENVLHAIENLQPNDGHHFFVELEEGKEVVIITQNVDRLHTKAGSSTIFEIHGSIMNMICPECYIEYSLDYALDYELPTCQNCLSALRPDLALFGDSVYMTEALAHLIDADLLIVAGTSLEVSPANHIPVAAKKYQSLKRILINNEPTSKDHQFDLVIRGQIGEVLREVKKHL